MNKKEVLLEELEMFISAYRLVIEKSDDKGDMVNKALIMLYQQFIESLELIKESVEDL